MLKQIVATVLAVFIGCGLSGGVSAQELKASDAERWFKGQTHMHTLWSDGDGAPDLAVHQYKHEYGFDFIVMTDHNIVPDHERWFSIEEGDSKRLTQERVDELLELFGEEWVEIREDENGPEMRLKTIDELKARFDEEEKFLLILGEEVTARVHINALNLREHIQPVLESQDNVYVIRKTQERVDEQSERYGIPMMAHVNHPNFSTGVSPADFIQAVEATYFEVYNGHGSVRNWGDPDEGMFATDRIWDIALAFRLTKNPENLLLGVATDDTHNYHWRGRGRSIPNRGWVMVLADKLAPRALLESLLAGRFYSTCGTLLDAVEYTESGIRVDIQEEEGVRYRTQFLGTRRGFDEATSPVLDENGKPLDNGAVNYSDDIGVVLHETTENPAVYDFKGDEIYVRAKIISDKPMTDPFKDGDLEMAWIQPTAVSER